MDAVTMDDPNEYRGIKGRIKSLSPAYIPALSSLLLGPPVLTFMLMLVDRWFGTTMGTGILSILLHQLPYQFAGLGIISTTIFLFNAILFVILCVASIIRYIRWPNLFVETMLSPVQSCSWYNLFKLCYGSIRVMVIGERSRWDIVLLSVCWYTLRSPYSDT